MTHPDGLSDLDSRNGAAALGAAPASGVLRDARRDFQVFEELGFEPSDDGPHALLYVEKTDLTTLDLIEQIARHARVRPRDIGYCGLKDRHAVTQQWLSLPLDRAADSATWQGAQWRVVEQRRNRRKLKIGAHKGNRFVLRVTSLDGDTTDLPQRVTAIRASGVPNYFGAQRFGHEGDNLRRARRWFIDGVKLNRRQRRFALSAARSWLFNRVLSARVSAGTWQRPLAGEPLSLDGSRSFFHADDARRDELEARLAAHDVHPSGPLWGAGESAASGVCRTFEAQAMAQLDWLAQGLAAQGLRQERRALRLQVKDLRAQIAEHDLVLEFALNKGCFATAVVHELVRVNGGRIFA